ncbi:MAG: hypothetical protein HDQ96_01700 [Lachnospiraceae bacterium]|nr:hypothetical protein [Lachnospiraceae bacterium]
MEQGLPEYARRHIKEYLPPDYRDADVTLEKIRQNNDRLLTGLAVHKEGSGLTPMVYLEPYMEEMRAGRRRASIMRELAGILAEDGREAILRKTMREDYDKARPWLAVRLYDPDKYREYLKDKPSMPCGELAAICKVRAREKGRGIREAPVTYGIMEAWGITKEQLHKDAAVAESTRNPACLYRMGDMLFGEECPNLLEGTAPLAMEGIPAYILTNHDMQGGAGTLAWDGILEKVGDLLGADFYVLPSSANEAMILPDDGRMAPEEMEQMVRDVNMERVAPQLRLSEKVQHYDRASKTLGRRQEKGLLGQLADNREQIREKDAGEKGMAAKQAGRKGPEL